MKIACANETFCLLVRATHCMDLLRCWDMAQHSLLYVTFPNARRMWRGICNGICFGDGLLVQ